MSDVNATATPSAEPAATPPATPAAATPAASAQPATPATPQAPATGAPGEGWVPSYRVRETREAAEREAQERWAAREAEYQAQLRQTQSQLRALVGVQPPQNPEVDAVRQQFAQLYPGLAKMEERANDFMSIIDRAQDLQTQTDHYWQSYGRQTMDRLFEKASSSLGAPLTEEGKRHLHASFVGFVQQSPEMTARYTSDPSIVDEFWNTFTSTFIDPARRVASANVADRAANVARLPNNAPSGAPQTTPVPKPSGVDERAALAWQQYQATAKQ